MYTVTLPLTDSEQQALAAMAADYRRPVEAVLVDVIRQALAANAPLVATFG